MKWQRKNLLDLPVESFDRDGCYATSRIDTAYITDRDSLSSSTQVRPFVRKWQNLWLLSSGRPFKNADKRTHGGSAYWKTLHPELKTLLLGDYDAKKVFWLLQKRMELGGIEENRDFVMTANILIPPTSFRAYSLATHYGGKSDIGYVRLYLDTWPGLENEWR